MTIYVDQWEEMCYAKKAAEPSAKNEVRQLLLMCDKEVIEV